MKQTLIRLSLFFSGIIAVILLCFLLNIIIINNSRILTVNDEINTLVLGASRTTHGINDNYLKNTINLSDNADSYFYTFLKLKVLLKHNPQIKKLILCLGPRNLSSELDNIWLLNKGHKKDRFLKYCYYMSFDNFKAELKYNLKGTLNSIVEIPKYSLGLLYHSLKGDLDIKDLKIGHYKELEFDNLPEEIKKLNSKKQNKYSLSKLETQHLFEIVNLCQTKNIDLIFIDTPIHMALNNSNQYKESKKIFSSFYQENLSSFKYIDYSELSVPDSSFGDLIHLNKTGAALLTKKLVEDRILN